MEFYQFFNDDLVLNQNATLRIADGAVEAQQRIYRRLLTATGKYIWHPLYGAGLPTYIGQNLTPALARQLKGIIKTQMFLEATVERNPEPIVTLAQKDNNIICGISYVYAPSKETYTLSFSITE